MGGGGGGGGSAGSKVRPGRHHQAIRSFEDGFELRPDSAAAANNYGAGLQTLAAMHARTATMGGGQQQRQQCPADAVALYALAVQLDPINSDAARNLRGCGS